MCTVSAAHYRGFINANAVKIYLAALEVRCRRMGKFGHIELKELAQVAGISAQAARVGEQGLKVTGLFELVDGQPVFNSNPQVLPESVRRYANELYDLLHPKTRDKPICLPRRWLRGVVLAGRGVARVLVLIAVALRVMLRKRAEEFGGFRGCCTAQWIAVFTGLSKRAAISGRRWLICQGWFREITTSPAVQRKYGMWLQSVLETLATPMPEITPEPAEPKLAPIPDPDVPKLSALLNQNLPSEEGIIEENQNPDSGPGPGGEIKKGGEGEDGNQESKPSWRNILPMDLTVPWRREALFVDAVGRGDVRDTEASRLDFFSAGLPGPWTCAPLCLILARFYGPWCRTPNCASTSHRKTRIEVAGGYVNGASLHLRVWLPG